MVAHRWVRLIIMRQAHGGGHLAGVVAHAAVLVREGVQHRRHDLRQQRIVLLLKADRGGGQAQQPTFPAISLWPHRIFAEFSRTGR